MVLCVDIDDWRGWVELARMVAPVSHPSCLHLIFYELKACSGTETRRILIHQGIGNPSLPPLLCKRVAVVCHANDVWYG